MNICTFFAAFVLLPTNGISVAQETSPRRYTIPELVREMAPAIVHIVALDSNAKAMRMGSGGILSDDGLVVTSYHLVQDASAVQIKTRDAEIYDRVDVVEFDVRRDIVLLKIRPFRPLQKLKLSPSDSVVVGEDVAALGNPEGLEASVSAGILSGERLNVQSGSASRGFRAGTAYLGV